jgi:iron(II)-dependent oxidoreductase
MNHDKEACSMKKGCVSLWVLFLLAFSLLMLPGCAGSGIPSGENPGLAPSETLMASSAIPPADVPEAEIGKGGAPSSIVLKVGWITFSLPPGVAATKFSAVTLTRDTETKTLNAASTSAPVWIESHLLVLRGRAWCQLSTSNGNNLLQPGTRYYIRSHYKGIALNFGKPYIESVSPHGGDPGTQVTVTGLNFGAVQGGSTITIGGTTAVVNSWSDTQIVCTAPANGQILVTANTQISNNNKQFSPFMELVLVPAGEFTMGTPEGEGEANESPQHVVYLDAYEIGKYPVTNWQFEAFVNETGYVSSADWRNADGSCVDYYLKYPDNPVLDVTWGDAVAFCTHYGYRLPTEAEWEKAARGTDGRLWPWGNTWDPNILNWYYGPDVPGKARELMGDCGTTPVDSFPAGASPYGAIDMGGNVWEWCYDWFDPDYYSVSPYANPQGPAGPVWLNQKVQRGGAYDYDRSYVFRCAYRYNDNVIGQTWTESFRVARSVGAQQ